MVSELDANTRSKGEVGQGNQCNPTHVNFHAKEVALEMSSRASCGWFWAVQLSDLPPTVMTHLRMLYGGGFTGN